MFSYTYKIINKLIFFFFVGITNNRYPKIFIDGKLIGGSNIMSKLSLNKDFSKIFPNLSTLNNQLGKLIQEENIVLFIKGTPKKPKCILSYFIAKFFTKIRCGNYVFFDVFSDQRVFRSFKKFFQWPTYPQIFFQGKFIGGFDAQSNSLKTSIKIHSISASCMSKVPSFN